MPGILRKGPLVTLHPQDLFYQRVKPEDVPRIVTETILGGKVIEDLLLEDPAVRRKILSSRGGSLLPLTDAALAGE